MEEKQIKKPFLTTKEMVFCAMFTALIAAGAVISFPLPSGVPVSLQFLFTNLAGVLLGRKKGLTSCLVYIILGLIGIPIFTAGGGIGYVLKPSFGYIIGFAVGAWLAGYISEKGKGTVMTYIWASLANMAVVFAIGLVYFYFIMNYYVGKPLDLQTLFVTGFLVFAPADVAYCILSGFLAKRLQPVLQKSFAAA